MSDQKGPYSKDGDDWYDVGTHLKATSGWNNNGNGTDDFGFPGGLRFSDGSFYYVGIEGCWWGATELSSITAWYRSLNYDTTKFGRYSYLKFSGFSVRCIRD